MGFAYRLLVRASLNPLINLSFLALLVAGVAFAARSGPILLLGTLLLPWIFFALLLLSLPFVGAAVRWFRIPEATRRNHALEHGTIALLRQQYGKGPRLTGKSSADGFRIGGAKRPRDITEAFRALLERLRAGETGLVVTTGCGSMIVTAQALGLVVFALTGLAFSVLKPAPGTVGVTVLAELAIVTLVRYPVGRYLQRKRFLSLGFEQATILSITPVNRAQLFERHPVFFVRTKVT
jgi:hypothetical protein